MNGYILNNKTEHVNNAPILLGIAIIVIISLLYFYLPSIFGSFLGLNDSKGDELKIVNNAEKIKDIKTYTEKTSSPAPKINIANEQFGRENPFLGYK